VRGCGAPLATRERALVCPRGHAFDLARRGYVNLLQPQDRRSPEAGDARSAVEARGRLLAAGVGAELIEVAVARALRGLPTPGPARVLDLGAGGGELLGALAAAGRRQGLALEALGIDLSVAAVERAARGFPELAWVVANADRRLPLLDSSVDGVLSIFGRRPVAEVQRVLRPGGRWWVAVPAADDLLELRAAVQGRGEARARSAGLEAECGARFRCLEREEVRVHEVLERETLLDLLRATYRGARSSSEARVEGLERLAVTRAAELSLWAPR